MEVSDSAGYFYRRQSKQGGQCATSDFYSMTGTGSSEALQASPLFHTAHSATFFSAHAETAAV